MFSRGTSDPYGGKPAGDGQRSADSIDKRALSGGRMYSAAARYSQWAVCNGAVVKRHGPGAFKRTTAGGAKQSGYLRTDRYAFADSGYTTAR